MVKGSRAPRRIASRQYRPTPYPLCSLIKIYWRMCALRNAPEPWRRDWEDATCSVCMEYPHLCSSHDKGCRSYMCGTSFQHSNCLDLYKKA